MTTKDIGYKEALESIENDDIYKNGVAWGFKRSGHPEGTIGLHIAELENNLELLKTRGTISEDEEAKIRLLIHVHDTLKYHAQPGVPIENQYSHASLAKNFLSQFIDNEDLLNMVQYHDEGYALFRKYEKTGTMPEQRFSKLIETIQDWRVFLVFSIADNCTSGKGREPLQWFLKNVKEKINTDIDESWILD